MSRHFTPIDLPTSTPVEKPPKVELPPFDPDKFKIAIEQVKQEVENLADGTSLYLNRAINFGSLGCPAQNQLKKLAAKPTIINFEGFVQLARQDFSARPAQAMEKILHAALVEQPSEKT